MKYASLLCLCLTVPAVAGPVDIVDVTATQSGEVWRFNVTVAHADTGWDDYADGWRVLDADGNELGLRVLAHPHVNEQPFTRSLSGVVIPAGNDVVFVQGRDTTDGWTDVLFEVVLPR